MPRSVSTTATGLSMVWPDAAIGTRTATIMAGRRTGVGFVMCRFSHDSRRISTRIELSRAFLEHTYEPPCPNPHTFMSRCSCFEARSETMRLSRN